MSLRGGVTGGRVPRAANNIPSDQAAMARLKDMGLGKESIIKRRKQHMHIIDQTRPNVGKILQRESNLPVTAS